MDVAAWLRGLGLAQYAPAFRDNDVDGEVLPELTADDLIGLGVTSIGHRRKLLAAIAALRTEHPTLAQSAAGATSAPSPAPISDAERRQLTVMFCDLVGSTALSTRLDPEDLRELIGDYHRAVSETVGGFDGFVAKYMGDGVLIYFGYPRAHEDDAERAVRAGLAVIETVSKLPTGEDLSVRLGIATGLAVVGDLIGEGAAQERGVIGETPNLAARLQALSTPNTLVIGEATRRQIGGLFDLEDLGPQQLAGFADPQRAWRILGDSGEMSRFEALRSAEMPFVGRDEEIELLIRRWKQSKAGEGRVVLITGEPGIGKSRLMAAFSGHIGTEPHTRLRYFCSPHHQDSALYPFIAQLERAAGFDRDDAVEARLGKLRASLALGTRDDAGISLLSELLSLAGSAADLGLSPQRKREKLLEALLSQLEAETRRRPVLMVFEDAHWIDPTSRELLDLAVDRVRRLPVLMLITFRPEFQAPWGGRAHVTSLALNRLGERDGELLVQTLAGNAALTADIVAEIVERTDGVPLFVEELTKAVLESAAPGDRIASVLATTSRAAVLVPATLHASLMARLDRLGPGKEVAQIASAIGRGFSHALLVSVARKAEAELGSAIDRLVEAGLLFRHGVPPQASYVFKHALVQDAAYGTLLREPRRALHARIAETLENRFAETTESRPEILAHHYTEAGLIAKAAGLWGKAGQQSLACSALVEAEVQLTRALTQFAALASTPTLRCEQIKVHIGLANAQMQTKGFAAPDTKASLEQARALIEGAEARGEPAEDQLTLFSVLFGFWVANLVAFNGDALRELAAEFLAIAKKQMATAPLMIGHRLVGTSSVLTGDFAEGRAYLDRAIALYVPREHRSLATVFASDIRVNILSSRLVALWCLGYPDAARKDADHALGDAREIGHAPTVMVALFWGTLAHAHCRDYATANAQLDELIALADEKGAPFWKALGMATQGCVFALAGQAPDAVPLIVSSIAAYRSTGSSHWMPFFLSILAKAYAQHDHFDDAWRCIYEAMALVEATRERWNEANVYRIAGEIALMSSDAAKAQAYFGRALEIARARQARSWELRAATSLARLWRDQDKRQHARDLLAPVYGWFTEGFDTADLKEAKALLDELT